MAGSSCLLHSSLYQFPILPSSSSSSLFQSNSFARNAHSKKKFKTTTTSLLEESSNEKAFCNKRTVLFMGIAVLPFLGFKAQAFEELATSKLTDFLCYFHMLDLKWYTLVIWILLVVWFREKIGFFCVLSLISDISIYGVFLVDFVYSYFFHIVLDCDFWDFVASKSGMRRFSIVSLRVMTYSSCLSHHGFFTVVSLK